MTRALELAMASERERGRQEEEKGEEAGRQER